MDAAIESAMAYYAPWGIDVTRFLVHTGTVQSFDLRILGPYGERLFADAPLAGCRQHPAIQVDIVALASKGVIASCSMRLYSYRAMHETWVDWAKTWQVETVLRWLPVVIPAAGLTDLILAAADQLISFTQTLYESNAGKAYLNLEALSASANYGAFVTEATGGALTISGEKARPTVSRFGFLQSLYSLALLFAIHDTDWYMLREVKSLTVGTRSYCQEGNCSFLNWNNDNLQLPPIMVIAVLQDAPEGHPAAGYPAKRVEIRAWAMPYWTSAADLHALYELHTPVCENFTLNVRRETLCPGGDSWPGGLADLPFEPYQQQSWPRVSTFTAPAGQSVRLSLPKAVLEQIGSDYKLGDTPQAADYGLVVRAEAPDGSRALFTIEQFLQARPGESEDRVYFQVVVEGTWNGRDADLGDLAEQYDGARGQLSGTSLQSRLAFAVHAHADEQPRATGEVAFLQGPRLASGVVDVPVREGDGAERIQVAKVDLQQQTVEAAGTYEAVLRFKDCLNVQDPSQCIGFTPGEESAATGELVRAADGSYRLSLVVTRTGGEVAPLDLTGLRLEKGHLVFVDRGEQYEVSIDIEVLGTGESVQLRGSWTETTFFARLPSDTAPRLRSVVELEVDLARTGP